MPSKELEDWLRLGAPVPVPHEIKKRQLARFFPPGAPVIETGTYKGNMARFLYNRGHQVHTIELSQELFAAYSPALESSGILCYHGNSALLLEGIVKGLLHGHEKACAICFWLDGHFSGGQTAFSEFSGTSPLSHELKVIEDCLQDRPGLDVFIAIDDARLLGTANYLTVLELAQWANCNNYTIAIHNDACLLNRKAS